MSKGSKYRPVNKAKYDANYDRIYRRRRSGRKKNDNAGRTESGPVGLDQAIA